MGKLISENAVVIASNFNPSILDKFWLIKQGIIAEDEFKDGSLYTPQVVQVETDNYQLLSVPDRLQLSFKNPKLDNNIYLNKVFGGIIKTLPHTPYKAVGFNLIWHSGISASEKICEITRNLFISKKNIVAKHFEDQDAHFGVFMSKSVDSMRMNLEIKPNFKKPNQLQATFNFHKELTEDHVVKIMDAFEKWNKTKTVANDIIATLEEEVESCL